MSYREAFGAVQSALSVPVTGIPNDATKLAFDALWDQALAEYRSGQASSTPPPPAPSDPVIAPPPANAPAVVIGNDHWIAGIPRASGFPPARLITPRVLVIHFTAGATGESSIEYWRHLANGICAHLVIERDGTVKQVRALNQSCGHAGVSRWRGTRNVNDFGIGIELANAGNDDGALSWARKQPGFSSIKARHRNGGPVVEWECYPPAQLAAVTAVARAIVARFQLADVTGHDCIAPERKDDPGPAFPMEALRAACGFSGLPEVFKA